MIKSMTGFGRGEYADDKRSVTAEIRAVNHRYCDVSVRLPKRYAFAEEKIKSIVREVAKRGKIEVSIITESMGDADVAVNLNKGLAGQYYESLKELANEFGIKENISLRDISSMPDVLKAKPCIEDEQEIVETIKKAVVPALHNFDEMRKQEGAKLKEDLEKRGEKIRELVDVIAKRAPKLQGIYAEKLKNRIAEMLGNDSQLSDERIATEAAIFADKANITEELVRLDSHMIQLKAILNGDKSEGKKLDFLVQEMNREANTIGSKANDLDITNTMLEIKSEIEKIREQVQNIE